MNQYRDLEKRTVCVIRDKPWKFIVDSAKFGAKQIISNIQL